MRAGKRLKRPKARKCADPRLWAIIWDKLDQVESGTDLRVLAYVFPA